MIINEYNFSYRTTTEELLNITCTATQTVTSAEETVYYIGNI